MCRAPGLAALLLVLSLGGCVHVYEHDASSPAPRPRATRARAALEEALHLQPWDEVVKDARPVEGLLKLYRKPDNTLLLELRPEQLERDYGLTMEFSRGLGVFGVQQGLPLGDVQLLRFRRDGSRLLLVRMNPRFTADPGSPMGASLERNVGNSVEAVLPLLSEHRDSHALLVDFGAFLLSDHAGVAEWLKQPFGGKPVTFDRERSYVGRALAFPRNDEIDAELTFRATDAPDADAAGVSDYRSIPVGVRYSFFALPERPMAPRSADDRVGYFTTAIRDFSSDRAYDPYRRYINRWRLEKKESHAPLSAPVRPIVYYIDPSVPREYRRYVKEGIEAWNKGFEAAGFRNAVVAVEAPENDTTWSAEDVRYSTVRWTAAHEMGFAIGPSQTDPRTGEILNADILVSSEFVRAWANTYATEAAGDPAAPGSAAGPVLLAGSPIARGVDRLCTLERGMEAQVGFQFAALAALGVIDGAQPMPEAYLGQALRQLIMHEVGHTLGLRHNMKASSAIPYERLNDREFTRQNGLTLSVMDYAPPNIALDTAQQGHYYSPEIGSYDVWAIRYGYSPFLQQPGAPDAEAEGLAAIARLAADPMHTYGTDEDTHFGALMIDPNSNTWDLGNDPLRFAADRAALAARIQPRLEQRLIAEGEGYQRLRNAFEIVLGERFNPLLTATKVVGGIYFSRDHRGDPDGRPPFVPVPAARQREAVRLIVDDAFAEGAVPVDPALLNKLPPTRQIDWSGRLVVPIDYPIHDVVVVQQVALLRSLLDNARLARMIDNAVRMPGGAEPYTVAEMMETLTGAIWSELGVAPGVPRPADSFRRNLQRAYVDELARVMLDAGPVFPLPQGRDAPPLIAAPGDARSLARYQLTRLDERIRRVLEGERAGLDATNRAHLMETRARIARALDATLIVAR